MIVNKRNIKLELFNHCLSKIEFPELLYKLEIVSTKISFSRKKFTTVSLASFPSKFSIITFLR